MNLIRYITQKSLYLLYIGCFIIFVIQMAVLIYNRMNPSQTISSASQKQLADLEFPVIFKICIKPAFDDEELNKAGYSSSYDYFLGCSKYDGHLLGWAGHTEDGRAVSNVSGCRYSRQNHQILFLLLYLFLLQIFNNVWSQMLTAT